MQLPAEMRKGSVYIWVTQNTSLLNCLRVFCYYILCRITALLCKSSRPVRSPKMPARLNLRRIFSGQVHGFEVSDGDVELMEEHKAELNRRTAGPSEEAATGNS